MGIVLKEETWPPSQDGIEVRDVVGFEGRYKIDTLGRVWTCFRRKYLSYRICKSGHAVVGLKHRCGEYKSHYVHILVLLTFRGPKPSELNCCRHLNDIPSDNRLENVYWGTRRENLEDAIRNGRLRLKLSRAQINEIRISDETQIALAAHFGVSQGYISDIQRGKGVLHV